MITVIFGTIPYPFQRAINWLDILLKNQVITEPVFLQGGVTNYQTVAQHPLVTATEFVEAKELIDLVAQSRFVISHAGQGTTRMLASQRASFVLVPRLKSHREHIDDHQLHFVRSIEQYGINYCLQLQDLENAVTTPPDCFQGKLFGDIHLSEYLMKAYPGSSLRRVSVTNLFEVNDKIKSAS